jgi:4-amino-4-deoxy-L-arabinose transferase-like glycosyltransferase
MTDQAVADKRYYAAKYLAVFLIAVIARLVYVGAFTNMAPPDTDGYAAIAHNLAHGKGFANAEGQLTAYRPPVYPLFLAAFERLTGTLTAALWTQALLQGLVVLMAAWLTRSIMGDIFALAAAGLVAVDPYLIWTCGLYMSECLFGVLAVFSVVLLIWSLRAGAVWKYALTGLVTGLAALTRPEFFVFLPGALTITARWGQRRAKLLSMLALVVATAVLPTAWAARNHQVFGRWVFATTHGGYTHRLAYNEVFSDEVVSGRSDYWGADSLQRWQLRINAEMAGMNEVERDKASYAAAAAFASADRQRAARVALYEIANFWLVIPHKAKGLMALGLGLFFLILLGLAIVGVYTAWRTRPAASLIVYLFVAETMVHAYYWSDVRMRIPFHPLLAVMAAVGIATLFGRKIRILQPVGAGQARPLYSPAA